MLQQKTKLKTSISLPQQYLPLWQYHASQITDNLPFYLKTLQTKNFRPIGLKTFNICPDGISRANVYWEQEIYDQLHAVAHALRMSVSHLLWNILQIVTKGIKVDKVFSNYVLLRKKWSKSIFILTEVIHFASRKNARHRKNGQDRRP
ncbi:MAG: hypothetical protein U1F16_16075 [Turneriella sp.]